MKFTTNAALPDTDSEVRSLDTICVNDSEIKQSFAGNLRYLLVGLVFGIVFVKAEIVSWFRIQEMFRLQSFHMYGIIGTAIVVAAISIALIKKFKLKTIDGEPVHFSKKEFNKGQVIGGLLFGLGWGITGACPGPLFAQLGAGLTAVVVVIASAILGTWVYGFLREKLPH
ncbi:MAG TPA: transporter [Chitinophagaceae bacterium]|nr:transporter [Chitinophagaceae bacterium]HAN37758.1 transporter [Chitinophagaceae bacterium]